MSHVVNAFPLDGSPFIDGSDFDDGNFDWDNSGDQLFGDLAAAPGHEEDIHDKRKNNADGEDGDGKNKRHEGNDKYNKKPGRKPLNNSEPTTVSLYAELFDFPYLTDPTQETQSTKSCRPKGLP